MAQAEDSILQVRQLRELKQTKEWESYQTDSGISTGHSCKKIWENTVENGQQAKQSQR